MSIQELMDRFENHCRAIHDDIRCMADDIEECRNDISEYGEDSEYVMNHLFVMNATLQRIGREASAALSGIVALNDADQNQNETQNDSYEIVTIFDRPVLFTNLRIPRDQVPDGLYCYDIRHDDECSGRMVELKDHVLVNHWGTVLSAKPFEPREYDGHIYSSSQGIVIEDDDYNYTGDEMTASEYISRYAELEQEYSEQNEDAGMEMT